jgi:hypothetical protein|tara:strand:- start:257 stop:460 length:204 start_codon:yes stop_codon:yes gene_type:complete
MSIKENMHFDGQRWQEQPVIFPGTSRVNLNDLMKRVKEEEKKTKRNNLAISIAALSVTVVLGIILTL